jgi:hypothetical protein
MLNLVIDSDRLNNAVGQQHSETDAINPIDRVTTLGV